MVKWVYLVGKIHQSRYGNAMPIITLRVPVTDVRQQEALTRRKNIEMTRGCHGHTLTQFV